MSVIHSIGFRVDLSPPLIESTGSRVIFGEALSADMRILVSIGPVEAFGHILFLI